ncbi:hypothetical protein, partial [Streptomyces sp. N35]|uniref:hypothetical protein n=1 Tax=Streptomyces sp. N35 TaxID=2795730 RepID=UPI001F2F7215
MPTSTEPCRVRWGSPTGHPSPAGHPAQKGPLTAMQIRLTVLRAGPDGRSTQSGGDCGATDLLGTAPAGTALPAG